MLDSLIEQLSVAQQQQLVQYAIHKRRIVTNNHTLKTHDSFVIKFTATTEQHTIDAIISVLAQKYNAAVYVMQSDLIVATIQEQ
jgi:hypothetical protein